MQYVETLLVIMSNPANNAQSGPYSMVTQAAAQAISSLLPGGPIVETAVTGLVEAVADSFLENIETISLDLYNNVADMVVENVVSPFRNWQSSVGSDSVSFHESLTPFDALPPSDEWGALGTQETLIWNPPEEASPTDDSGPVMRPSRRRSVEEMMQPSIIQGVNSSLLGLYFKRLRYPSYISPHCITII